MKTYLITGGAGFIGSNFIKYMLEKYSYNVKLIVLDKLTYAGNLMNLENELNRITFIKGDICNKMLIDSIFSESRIDYVVNFAAESHVDRSIENPLIFLETNIIGTQVLLGAAKKHWLVDDDVYRENVKFIQISTDEVYGSLGSEGYFNEQTPISPHSPYSASKASADLLVQVYYDTYKLPINITRCSNNYGPNQFPEKLIPLMLNNAINGIPLPVYGDGLNVRDWLYVKDHCKAIDIVINSGRIGEVYNVGGHNERTNIYIVNTIIDYLKQNVDSSISSNLINYVKDRKGHDRRYGIDSNKLSNELGWFPETTFEKGIAMTINWYMENNEWLKNITSGLYMSYYEKMYKPE